jgi:hypothetical protein
MRLLATAYRNQNSPYVCPAIFKPSKPMSKYTYYMGWRRILERAGVPHVGTHGVRHRAATDIANSGVPVKVGMALTAHKTVQMFMRYVHAEDDPIRAAAELVANRRKAVVDSPPHDVGTVGAARVNQVNPDAQGHSGSRTATGNYRPFHHRLVTDRSIPPGTKRATGVEPSEG